MTKFKVGDRIATYYGNNNTPKRDSGTVIKIETNNLMKYESDDGGIYSADGFPWIEFVEAKPRVRK